jgi:hypothetical protein
MTAATLREKLTEEPTSYYTAGVILQLYGVLLLGATVVFFGMGIARHELSDRWFLPMMLLAAAVHFWAGKAIRERSLWARAVGIVLAVIMLFGHWFVMLIGAFTLLCLIMGWGADVEVPFDVPFDVIPPPGVTPPPTGFGRNLYWAWSGEQPFGFLDSPPVGIFGFVVALSPGGGIYRFSCDREWIVHQDSLFGTPRDAMTANFPQYAKRPIRWIKYDDTDVEAALEEAILVPLYKEVGGRDRIGRVHAELRRLQCEGMAVQRVEGGWQLSIQRKDLALGRQILAQELDRRSEKRG